MNEKKSIMMIFTKIGDKMEKSSAELFNESVEIQKEINETHDNLDTVEKEICALRNKIDELRTQIRNKENEVRDWKKIIRTKRYLADKADIAERLKCIDEKLDYLIKVIK